MTDRQKKDAPRIAPPDGTPNEPPADRDSTKKSRVSEVQDPLISGDAGKPGVRIESDEANVDEAGQVNRKKSEIDLLH
jgi:hypothetical protein